MKFLLILLIACSSAPIENTTEQELFCPGHPRCHPWSCVAVGQGDLGLSFECDHSENADWQCVATCDDDSFGSFCPDPSDGGDTWAQHCTAVCSVNNHYGCERDCMNQQTTLCVAGEMP